MSLILPRRFKSQPQYPEPLKDPGFWRLVDIQGLPPLGTAAASITRTLNETTKLGTGRAGKCVDFVADGDWLSYGVNPALQLSTMTGLAVIEIPSSPSDSATIFNTRVGPTFAGGFAVVVETTGAVYALKQDVVRIGTTTKKVKLGGLSTVAWSYNNISGLLRIAIDGVIQTFTSAQTFTHDIVGRNRYYFSTNVQAKAHKQYLFALSAECDRVTNSELIAWSNDPWSVFKAPPRQLWAAASAGGATHDLVGAASTQSNAASTVAITQAHALGGATSAQANSASTGTITQAGSFAADNVIQSNASSTGSITQTHALAADSATQGNTGSTGAITQGAQFSADPATQPNTAGTGSITQAHVLAGASSTQPNTASAASITQAHVLTGAGATQANTAASGAISTGVVHNLAASQSTQANTGSAGAISQTHVLVLAPSVQDNIAAASAIVQAHIIAASSATQSNSASSGAISAGDNALVSIVERTAVFQRSKSVTVRFN